MTVEKVYKQGLLHLTLSYITIPTYPAVGILALPIDLCSRYLSKSGLILRGWHILEASKSTTVHLPPLKPGGSSSPTHNHESSDYSHLPLPTCFPLKANLLQLISYCVIFLVRLMQTLQSYFYSHAPHYMHPSATPTTPRVKYAADVSHATSGSATPSLPPLNSWGKWT